MCGIFGLVNYGDSSYVKAGIFRAAVNKLLKEAERRGRDASGICVVTGEKAYMYKSNVQGSDLVQTVGYSDTIRHISHTNDFRSIIGHTRAQTKGSKLFNVNNHPIVANRVIGVHNGMIGNDDALFDMYKISRSGQVDSEIIFRLIDHYTSMGKGIVEAVMNTHEDLAGSYACAFIHMDEPRYLTIFNNSRCGGITLYVFKNAQSMVFASTESIIKDALTRGTALDPCYMSYSIEVSYGGARIDTQTGKIYTFKLEDSPRYGTGLYDQGYRNIGEIARQARKNKERRDDTAKSQYSACDICHMGSVIPGHGAVMACAQCSMNED